MWLSPFVFHCLSLVLKLPERTYFPRKAWKVYPVVCVLIPRCNVPFASYQLYKTHLPRDFLLEKTSRLPKFHIFCAFLVLFPNVSNLNLILKGPNQVWPCLVDKRSVYITHLQSCVSTAHHKYSWNFIPNAAHPLSGKLCFQPKSQGDAHKCTYIKHSASYVVHHDKWFR